MHFVVRERPCEVELSGVWWCGGRVRKRRRARWVARGKEARERGGGEGGQEALEQVVRLDGGGAPEARGWAVVQDNFVASEVDVRCMPLRTISAG